MSTVASTTARTRTSDAAIMTLLFCNCNTKQKLRLAPVLTELVKVAPFARGCFGRVSDQADHLHDCGCRVCSELDNLSYDTDPREMQSTPNELNFEAFKHGPMATTHLIKLINGNENTFTLRGVTNSHPQLIREIMKLMPSLRSITLVPGAEPTPMDRRPRVATLNLSRFRAVLTTNLGCQVVCGNVSWVVGESDLLLALRRAVSILESGAELNDDTRARLRELLDEE